MIWIGRKYEKTVGDGGRNRPGAVGQISVVELGRHCPEAGLRIKCSVPETRTVTAIHANKVPLTNPSQG